MTIEAPKIDFKKIVERNGVPTTEEGWVAEFKKDVVAEGSSIANDSAYSPFWRLVSGLIAKPLTNIVNKLIIGDVLPNMFLLTATDDEFIQTKGAEHNLTPKAEAKALGKVRFYRAAAAGPGLLIPAGTVVQTDAINGTVYRLISTNDVILPEGVQSVLVEMQAELAGAAFNLGEGYYHVLPESVTGIGRVSNEADWIDSPGADAESRDEFKIRIQNAFTAIAGWHIDAVYRAMLTERAGIESDNVYFEHDAPRGPGTANAYILLDTGEPSAELIADLNTHIMADGNHGHGDDMQVMAMPGVDADVGVVIYPKSDLLETEVTELLAGVEHFIRCAFRENSDYSATQTKPHSRFSFSRLGQELHAQFAGLDSLGWDQGDITSAMNVPRLNSLSVTNGNAA